MYLYPAMIIVNLKGGIGNQMFQYAAGFAVAKQNNTSLKLDLSQLNAAVTDPNYTKRDFDLGIFNLQPNLATEEECLAFKPSTSFSYRLKRKFFPALIKNKFYHEDRLIFDPYVFTLGDNAYLDAYFQSEKYFSKYATNIRKQFSFKNKLTGKNAELSKKMQETNSISLHVRRGDYLLPVNEKLFGNICTTEYYQKAIEYIKNKIEKPVFFIFSNDLDWVKKNLDTGAETVFVEGNTGDKSHEDMQLMSYCKHTIIANSSFSWWGAWLNENLNKIVVAPSKWLNDPTCIVDDVIPASWVKT